MKLTKVSWYLICIVLGVSIGLAACGGGDEPTPTVAAPTATPTAAAAESAVSAEAQPVTVTASAPTVAAMATPVALSPAPSPAAAVTATVPLTAATATPVCAIEPNADLVGYADMEARMGCPLGEATNDPVAINEFGKGPDYNRFMLWFGSEQQIYVLLSDKTWLAYSDTWSEDQPEIACNPDKLDPPTSPPLPRRGFGKLWCTVESVRLALGNIDREERLCQHAVAQRFEQGRLLACFEDATIRYFRVLDDGTWDMEMVQ